MLAGLLLAALLQDPEVAKARDKLNAAIVADDVKAAREALEVARRDARVLVAAMARTRERQRALDRALEEDHKEEARLEASGSGSMAKLDAVRDRHGTHHSQLLHIEDIHDALREALHALGAAAMAPVAEELEKSGSWLARWEMAEALGRMPHEEVARTILARLEKEPADLVAAQLLEGLAARGGAKAGAVKAVAGRLESRAWQARVAAARALAAGGSRDAVEPLVAAAAKSDGLPRLEYDAALRKITGTDVGDPGRWADWWNQHREAWLDGTYKAPPARPGGGPGKTRFYGLEVKSTRLAVVIDRSSSMDEKTGSGKDGPRKIAVVREELKGLLGALPDGARMNVLFFGDKVDAFAPAPRALDGKCRKDAQAFIESINPARRTNLFDGVARALASAGTAADGQGVADGIDTIYLLSDGEPTYGTVTWSNLAERVVRRVNRPLKVTVHCIAVGDTGALLKSIAGGTGGEYVQK
jgi:hypothetical protein